MDLDRLVSRLTGGRELYRWQRRLLQDWLEGRRHDAVDLPTGLGKTTVMTLWLIARAMGAELPRRLVYVVDRRAVVDQASAEAAALAGRLDELLAQPEWGERLRTTLGLHQPRATGGSDGVLPISTLRGQHLDNQRWREDPASAAIIVGTVDMIGSRLLFEGYGVSRRMRPAHAGLLGVDALVLLDEAHLVPPFDALVRQATKLGSEAPPEGFPAGLAPAIQMMSLSATGAAREGQRGFRLCAEDRTDPPVRSRLEAVKRLRLLPDATPTTIADRLADQALDFVEGGRRVIVFCNSRTTAQKVADRLRKETKGKGREKAEPAVELLVGERRYRERVRLTGDGTAANPGSAVFQRFAPGGPADSDKRLAFLVATSAGEVGVDLDADDMVCDLVPWERMVQRLGRVNRRPAPGEARVAVIAVAKEKEAEDEIDDRRLEALRAPFISPAWPEGADGARDASPGALLALKADKEFAELINNATTPEPLRPPLTRAVVDAWSLTSLDEHPGRPNVEPWIRGWVSAEPQTGIVWRCLFPLRKGEEHVTQDLREFFEVAPPHVSERLDAPSRRLAEVLIKRAKAFAKGETADDGAEDAPDTLDEHAGALDTGGTTGTPLSPSHQPVVVALAADHTVERLWTAPEIAGTGFLKERFVEAIIGRTLVVDRRLGGLDEDGLLTEKAAPEPATLDGDPAKWGVGLGETAGFRVSFGSRPDTIRGDWRLAEFRWSESDAVDAPSLWVELWRGSGANPGRASIAAQPQRLEDHHAAAQREAERIADAIGLPPPWREVLIGAARWHDRGKARKLWQDAMGAPRDEKLRPFAKTIGGGNGRALDGYRHEFGSLREIAAGPEAFLPPSVAGNPDLLDLALHLVTAHHGWARPLIKARDPDLAPALAAPLAREAALRFARLQAAWGPWRLAWWETLLRAADWAASRALNEEAATPDAPPSAIPAALEVADG